jgi:hypothetical protein
MDHHGCPFTQLFERIDARILAAVYDEVLREAIRVFEGRPV